MEGSVAGVRKGAWTKIEDDLLKTCVQHYGEGKWHLVPQRSGLNRCRKSCRLRWVNYLRPNIKRGDFSDDEIDLMIRLHKLLGNRWSLIAGRLPGRTSNDVKNYWNTYMRNRAQWSHNKKDKNVKQEAVKPHQVIKPQPRTFSKPKQSSDDKSSEVIVISSQACAASSGSTDWWETLLDDMGDDNTIALDEELIASITTNACDFLTQSDQTWSDFLLH